MNVIHSCTGHPPERNATLIGHDDDPEARSAQLQNRFDDSGQEGELIPALDVLMIGRLSIDDTVAVEKYSPDSFAHALNNAASTSSLQMWPIMM
jgi:hypothetical protein